MDKISNYIPEPNTKEIKINSFDEILEDNDLFNKVPWLNYQPGESVPIFKTGEKETWYYVNKITFDLDPKKYGLAVKVVNFDSVAISGYHSFAGTSYDFFFFLDEKPVDSFSSSAYLISNNIDSLKKKLKDHIQSKIDYHEKELDSFKSFDVSNLK